MRNIQSTNINPSSPSDIERMNTDELKKQLSAVYSRSNMAVTSLAVSADTTLTYKDSLVIVDTSGGNVTITLAPANSWGPTKSPIIAIIKTGATNTLTIAPASGDTLNYWLHNLTITAGSITSTGIVVLMSDGATKWYALTNTTTDDYSGTYTPTLSNTTNVAASTAQVCQYMRVGDTVTVSGGVWIDPTAATTKTVLGLTIPVASNFVNAYELAGTCTNISPGGQPDVGGVTGDTTNDRATITCYPASALNALWYFHFTYQVL
jgi:hypothetical protein